ncbi:MAG: hypothetical protein ACPGED_06815 [Flavobacteriales bacterium]
MNLQERKLRIIEQIITEADEETIEALEQRLADLNYDKVSQTKVIGLNPKGLPVVKSDFMKLIRHSLMAVENGEWIGLDELETRSENW